MTPRHLSTVAVALATLGLTASPVAAAPRVRVAIELRPEATPIAHAASPLEATGGMSARSVRALRNPRLPAAQRARIAARDEASRERALRRLAPRVAATERVLHRLARRIERHGGAIVEMRTLTGGLVALVPRRVAARIRRWRQVATVERDVPPSPRSTPSAIQAVGVPSFWAPGFLGGTGSADCPANKTSGAPRPECVAWTATSGPDLAIWADPIQKDHPAFAGVTFQTVAGAPANTNPTYEDHGTPVAGMAISRGVASCPSAAGYACNPPDIDAGRKGAAYGVDSVLDTHAMTNEQVLERYSEAGWMLGFDQTGYETGATIVGAADPAEVMNHSGGSTIQSDDSPGDRAYDAIVDQYGVTYVEAGGNSGTSIGVAGCRAYNGICVGATAHNGTADVNDDQIAYYSQRGPTYAGRKKPDLVAPGDATRAANRDWKEESLLWRTVEGTSFASPIVAGSTTLLVGSGLTDPKVVKAVLINSARSGRATPAAAMGTQTGWQADWGWGMLDMTAALAQRTNFDRATVDATDAAFYAATTRAAGDRATLVWNRHALGCFLGTAAGCGDATAQPLTDLNLYEHAAAAAGECETPARGWSTSAIDNVEQIRTAGAANVIYRVAASGSGTWTEPFAIAGTRQVRRLVSPRPHVVVTAADSDLLVGETTTVTAAVTNPSDEMTACDPTVAAPALDGGVELVDGGTLSPDPGARLSPGETFTKTWTVRATSAGVASVTVAAADRAYQSELSGRDEEVITVSQPPPPDDDGGGSGDGDAGTPQPPITQPPAGQPPTAQPPTGPAVIFPPPLAKADPGLRLSTIRVARNRRAIWLRGRAATAIVGAAVATVRVNIAGKSRRLSGRGQIRAGAFRVKVKLPSTRWRVAFVTVSFAGDSRFVRARTATRAVRAASAR